MSVDPIVRIADSFEEITSHLAKIISSLDQKPAENNDVEKYSLSWTICVTYANNLKSILNADLDQFKRATKLRELLILMENNAEELNKKVEAAKNAKRNS